MNRFRMERKKHFRRIVHYTRGHAFFVILQLWFLVFPLFPNFSNQIGQTLWAQPQQFSNLNGTFWLDLDLNLVVSPYSQQLKKGQQIELKDLIRDSQVFVLEEASYVFHGMIHGYQVLYNPADKFHQQEETFLIIAENPEFIAPNNLEIYHIGRNSNRFYYSVRKKISRFESFNIQAWQQADKKTLHAVGVVPFQAASNTTKHNLEPELMIQLRKSAIDNAIKEAVRNYFRRYLRNKPAQIRVSLALSAVPEMTVGSSEIRAKVRLHMGAHNIKTYTTR